MARPSKDAPLDRQKAHELTIALIEKLECPPDLDQVFLRDTKSPSLRVRATTNGAKSFIFEGKLNRKTIRITIGSVKAWKLADARIEANRLRTEVDKNIDPRETKRQQIAEQQAMLDREKAALTRQKFTLSALLQDYCDHQASLGRTSHSDARSIFDLHVDKAWPELAALPAADITAEQVADMSRRLHTEGKGRTANKLRAYMHSAYQKAKASHTKSSIPEKFKAYEIRHNPVADTDPDESANRSAKNPLLQDEIQRYWSVIKDMEGTRGAVLRFHLLTGAQRQAQLVKLKNSNISPGMDCIILIDTKGRPGNGPRQHVLPLTWSAFNALKAFRQPGVWAISARSGQSPLSARTLSQWANEAAEVAGIENFQTKRLRSGVETILASVKVSEKDRGHLQSHGISGVQSRHYDGYEYSEEKLEAMMTLEAVLEGVITPKLKLLSMEERRHPDLPRP